MRVIGQTEMVMFHITGSELDAAAMRKQPPTAPDHRQGWRSNGLLKNAPQQRRGEERSQREAGDQARPSVCRHA
jgi:hypothetical protein